jgi:hypothetical protein
MLPAGAELAVQAEHLTSATFIPLHSCSAHAAISALLRTADVTEPPRAESSPLADTRRQTEIAVEQASVVGEGRLQTRLNVDDHGSIRAMISCSGSGASSRTGR